MCASVCVLEKGGGGLRDSVGCDDISLCSGKIKKKTQKEATWLVGEEK